MPKKAFLFILESIVYYIGEDFKNNRSYFEYRIEDEFYALLTGDLYFFVPLYLDAWIDLVYNLYIIIHKLACITIKSLWTHFVCIVFEYL